MGINWSSDVRSPLLQSESIWVTFQRGVQRITQEIDVNGDEYTATATIKFFDNNGVLLRTGCATGVGRRFEEDKDKD